MRKKIYRASINKNEKDLEYALDVLNSEDSIDEELGGVMAD